MNPINQPEADLIIEAAYVIPVAPRGRILKDHAVTVNNKRITSIVPSSDISDRRAKRKIRLSNHVLMPGFVNAHGHISMSLFRGLVMTFHYRSGWKPGSGLWKTNTWTENLSGTAPCWL